MSTWKILRTGVSLMIAGVILVACTQKAAPAGGGDEQMYQVLDPRGIWPPIQRSSLAARVGDLRGKTVYIINSWAVDRSGFGPAIQSLTQSLEKKYPGVKVRLVDRNTPYAEDDPELWKILHEEADAFVYLGAASSSTTAYAFKWSAGLEKSGLPGAVVMYDTLLNVAQSVREREGVPVRYAAFGYPLGLLTPQALQQRTDEVIAALVNPLTAEEQRTGAVARAPTPEILFSGTLDQVQAYFHKNGLSDGLPIVPPTRSRVDAMLKGTSHARDKVLTTKMPPQELTVTVEKVAIIGVMAGCDPSHMPVLLASFEAFMRQDRNAIIRSTNSFGFMQVVNGPIRRELEMNAGAQLLAPGNHANASIGRALRMFITNLGGGEPGVNLMGVIGTMANWPFLFAEFEEQNPWESLAVSRGHRPEDSTLTMYMGGWSHAGNYGHERFGLAQVAEDLVEFENARGAVVIISPKRAEMLAAAGMSRKQVQEYLAKNAKGSLEVLRRSSYFDATSATRSSPGGKPVEIYTPDSIDLVVAGGDASPMMQAWHMGRPVTVSIDAWR